MIDMENVLTALAENENPEEAFAQGLQGDEEVEKSAEATEGQETETPETPEASEEIVTDGTEDVDMAKVAEADAQGRIMARAFVDEMQKLGVAPMADYPADPGSVPNNPAVEMGRGEAAQPHGNKSATANAAINALSAANKVGAGEIANPAGVQPFPGKADPQEGNLPLAADAAAAQTRAAVPGVSYDKTAALKIVDVLHGKYFVNTEEETNE